MQSPVSQRRTVSVSSDEGFASFGHSYNSCNWSNGVNSDEVRRLFASIRSFRSFQQQLPVGQGVSWEELIVFRTAQSLAKLRLVESQSERPKKAREDDDEEDVQPRANMFNAFNMSMVSRFSLSLVG